MVECILPLIKSLDILREWECLGFFPTFFWTKYIVQLSSPVQFAIRCFQNLSQLLVHLSESLQRSNLKDFSFNCWSLVLTFPRGVCSQGVVSNSGASTASQHSEVAYSWSFFLFKMLCKVNRAVDTRCRIQSTVLWSNDAAGAHDPLLWVCDRLYLFYLVQYFSKTWYDISVTFKGIQIKSCTPVKPHLWKCAQVLNFWFFHSSCFVLLS